MNQKKNHLHQYIILLQRSHSNITFIKSPRYNYLKPRLQSSSSDPNILLSKNRNLDNKLSIYNKRLYSEDESDTSSVSTPKHIHHLTVSTLNEIYIQSEKDDFTIEYENLENKNYQLNQIVSKLQNEISEIKSINNNIFQNQKNQQI